MKEREEEGLGGGIHCTAVLYCTVLCCTAGSSVDWRKPGVVSSSAGRGKGKERGKGKGKGGGKGKGKEKSEWGMKGEQYGGNDEG